MQSSGTMPLTWFSMFTLTRHTSLHQKLAAVLVVTSSLAISCTMETQLNWMDPFTLHAPSSSLLLLPQQKQNWVHFSWTRKKLNFYHSSLRNLAIHYRQLQYTLTTQQQLGLSTTIKWQKSQAMEMRYFWLLDGKTQWYFKFYQQPSPKNLDDYPSNHHAVDMSGHIMSTCTSPPLSYQELWSQALVEGVLKSLGIPTPRNSHYQALAVSLFWPTPLSYPVIKYLASQEYNRDIPLPTTIQE